MTTLVCLAAFLVGFLTTLSVGLACVNARVPLGWSLGTAVVVGCCVALIISAVGLGIIGALP